jgi:hypothetical protein
MTEQSVKKQKFEDCIYGFETVTRIEEDPRNSYILYACLNECIKKLGSYNTREVLKDNKPILVASLHKTMDTHTISEQQKAKIESFVDRALAGCTHCKFYEPKK